MNFHIGRKGFFLQFENGYGVSVQIGPGNYCDNYDRRIGEDEELCGKEGSSTAETAIIGLDGKLMPDPEDKSEYVDSVQAYQTIDQVMDRLARVRAWPKP